MKVFKVFIGIPSVNGTITSGLAKFLLNLQQYYYQKINLMIVFEDFTVPHDAARNMLIKKFLETDANYFMGIDADVIPPSDSMQKLIGHNKDFISAIVHKACANKKKIEAIPTIMIKEENIFIERPVSKYYNESVIKIDSCGTGCFLAKRKVFETIKKPFEFTYNNDGIVTMSEDLNFCLKLQKAGFKIYADTSIICKHIKMIDISSI